MQPRNHMSRWVTCPTSPGPNDAGVEGNIASVNAGPDLLRDWEASTREEISDPTTQLQDVRLRHDMRDTDIRANRVTDAVRTARPLVKESIYDSRIRPPATAWAGIRWTEVTMLRRPPS